MFTRMLVLVESTSFKCSIACWYWSSLLASNVHSHAGTTLTLTTPARKATIRNNSELIHLAVEGNGSDLF
jgi:hypothetical protein